MDVKEVDMITIDEAIRLKQLTGDEFLQADPDELEEAEQLSIEALKRERTHREGLRLTKPELLPGETED